MAGSADSDIGAKYVQQVLDRFGYGDGEEDSSEPEEEVDGLTIFSSVRILASLAARQLFAVISSSAW